MKDRFFQYIFQLYKWIYGVVHHVVYALTLHKLARGTDRLTPAEKHAIRKFWRKYSVHDILLDDYRWYKSKGWKVDPRMIPDKIYHSQIEPHFTNLRLLDGFQDKNYFDTILDPQNRPECICRCVDGQLLDQDYRPIKAEDMERILHTMSGEVICKPSMDTSGGKGIRFLATESFRASDCEELIQSFKRNFVVQKLVRQHAFMSQFNATSLNTIRIVTFLFKGEVHLLSGFVRLGKAGSKLDNVSAGGLYAPIRMDGTFYNTLLDYECEQVQEQVDHVDMSELQIPFWEEIGKVLTRTHFKLAHFPIINWDVALSEDGTPVIIEYNLIDTDAYGYQVFGGPIFGDLTDQVLEECFGKKK